MPVIIVGQVTVPDVRGLSLAAARAALAAQYLVDNTAVSRDFAQPNNLILSQNPAGGTDIDPDSVVSLVLVSRGSSLKRYVRDLDVTRPNTPTGFVGLGNSETQITLSWNAATDPQGTPSEGVSGVSIYRVYKNGLFNVSLPNTSVQMPGLSPYTLYSFQVSSVDAVGNESLLSAPISVRTLDTTAPSIPTVTATQTGSSTISVALTVASSDSGSGV
jgi:chitodextrinase